MAYALDRLRINSDRMLAAFNELSQIGATGDARVNVGRIEIAPGAFNIVPARAELWFEFRSPDALEFALLDSALNECARKLAVSAWGWRLNSLANIAQLR